MRNKLFWIAFGAMVFNLSLSAISLCEAQTAYYGSEISKGKSWIHITLEVDGKPCEFNHVAPSGMTEGELQAYVEKRADFYRLCILKDMYPSAPKDVRGSLEDMEAWIADGCWAKSEIVNVSGKTADGIAVIRAATAEDGQFQVEKVAWKGEHPPKSLEEKLEALEARVEALEEQKDIGAK